MYMVTMLQVLILHSRLFSLGANFLNGKPLALISRNFPNLEIDDLNNLKTHMSDIRYKSNTKFINVHERLDADNRCLFVNWHNIHNLFTVYRIAGFVCEVLICSNYAR